MSTLSPKVSIIVPVYKVEQYLPKCIDSILAQTYDNWELLLIDDGSPDHSGEICDDYALKDIRIKVFHKENEGVSSARNLGLDKANGDYIMFVDSDDWISEECLEICTNEIIRNNLEALQFGFISVFHDQEIFQIKEYTDILNGVEYINTRCYNACIAGGLYTSSIIEKHHLRFPVELKLAEDQVFVLNFLRYTKRIKYLNNAMYYYMQNRESATHNSKSQDMLLSCDYLYSFSKEWNAAKEHIDYIIVLFIIAMLRNKDVSYKRLKYIYSRQNIGVLKHGPMYQIFFSLFAKLNFYVSCKMITLYIKWRKC